MQVDPVKPTLKAPGTERLKVKHEEVLSNFGFTFNLRHYNLVNDAAMPPSDAADIAYAHQYLRKTTNLTNCHAVPFPSGMIAIAASKDIRAGEELLISYTFG